MNITIREISKNDRTSLEIGRSIFINYFMDLYKDIAPEVLGITGSTQIYLENIFEKTQQALMQNNLHACLAYSDNMAIGFTTFNPLEDPRIILVCTIALNFDSKSFETKIRSAFIGYIMNCIHRCKK